MNSDTSLKRSLSHLPETSENGKLPPPEVVLEKGEEEDFDIKQILTILKRRFLIIVSVFTPVSILLSLLVLCQPPNYSGKFSVLVEPVTQGQRLTNSLTSSAEAQRTDATTSLDYDPQYVSQIAVLKSQNLLEPIAKEVQVRYPNITAASLSYSLKITNPKDTKILDISYDSQDPAQVQFVLQKVAEGFLKYSIDDRQRNLLKGIDYADDQLKRQNQRVEVLEAQLEAFRKTNNLLDPQEVSKALSSQLSGLLSDQRTNQVKYVATRSLYGNLLQQLRLNPSEGVIVANLSESPGYLDLLSKLRDVEARLAKESARLRSNTPVVNALQDERDRLLPLLQAEAQRILGKGRISNPANGQDLGYQGSVGRDLIKSLIDSANEVQVLQAQQIAIARALSDVNGEIRTLATSSRSYGEISRNLAIATDSLSRLQAARENLQLEYARQRNVWVLLSKIDESSVNNTSGTSRKVLLANFVGLLLGVAAAFLAEKLDRILHSPDDLKATHLPVLGMIPYEDRLKQLPIINDQTVPASVSLSTGVFSFPNKRHRFSSVFFLEAFYALDANLRLLSADEPIRSVVVSSATANEGKSTVAIHLAIAAANMGRRVLLVDADLRLSQIHQRLKLSNVHGLSTLLTSDADPMELIQPLSEDLELYVLTAGQTPPVAGRLLASKKMAKVVEFFIARFDLVIFDSPPLLGFVDAKLLAVHTNGLLLVAGLGKIKRDDLNQSLEGLNTTAQNTLLGIIANGLVPSVRNNFPDDNLYQEYYQAHNENHLNLSK